MYNYLNNCLCFFLHSSLQLRIAISLYTSLSFFQDTHTSLSLFLSFFLSLSLSLSLSMSLSLSLSCVHILSVFSFNFFLSLLKSSQDDWHSSVELWSWIINHYSYYSTEEAYFQIIKIHFLVIECTQWVMCSHWYNKYMTYFSISQYQHPSICSLVMFSSIFRHILFSNCHLSYFFLLLIALSFFLSFFLSLSLSLFLSLSLSLSHFLSISLSFSLSLSISLYLSRLLSLFLVCLLFCYSVLSLFVQHFSSMASSWVKKEIKFLSGIFYKLESNIYASFITFCR